uniref:Uncharacterized protein n=1 Tax=Geospiza parvula TaxID=87175 RepID=A0A8C3M6Y9_GEOPR
RYSPLLGLEHLVLLLFAVLGCALFQSTVELQGRAGDVVPALCFNKHLQMRLAFVLQSMARACRGAGLPLSTTELGLGCCCQAGEQMPTDPVSQTSFHENPFLRTFSS